MVKLISVTKIPLLIVVNEVVSWMKWYNSGKKKKCYILDDNQFETEKNVTRQLFYFDRDDSIPFSTPIHMTINYTSLTFTLSP